MLPMPIPGESYADFLDRAFVHEGLVEQYPNAQFRVQWIQQAWQNSGMNGQQPMGGVSNPALFSGGTDVDGGGLQPGGVGGGAATGGGGAATGGGISKRHIGGRKRAKKRRITSAHVTHISLVPRGANQMPVLYKSEDQHAEFQTLSKGLNDQGELTAVVYAPENPDSQGDFASAEVIKKMAYDFAKRGLGDIDLVHNGMDLPKNAAHVAETFLIQKGDERFAGMKDYSGNEVDLTGAWAVVIKIEDERLRKLYREGGWNGVSLLGPATVKAAQDSSFWGGLIGKALGRGQSEDNTGEIDMTGDELAAALEQQGKAIVEGIGGVLAKQQVASKYDAALLKKAGVTDEDTPNETDLKVQLYKAQNPEVKKTDTDKGEFKRKEYDGDPTDAAALAKWELEQGEAEILHKMDRTDPADVRRAADEIAKLRKEAEGEEEGEEEDGETAELRKELGKAKRGSNQQKGDGVQKTRLSKEDAAAAEAGREMAAIANNDHATLAKIDGTAA